MIDNYSSTVILIKLNYCETFKIDFYFSDAYPIIIYTASLS